jgi:hypothetical protein
MILLYRAGAPAADARCAAPSRVHVVASALGARALGPQLPRVLLGRPLRGEGHVDAVARDVMLRFTGSPGSGAYVLDGELLHAQQVHVSPGPVLRHLSA